MNRIISGGAPLEELIALMAKLPGLGPRSARRAALHLLKNREALMEPLAARLAAAVEAVQACEVCFNWDVGPVCSVCRADNRDRGLICVVEDVADLWALERAGAFSGLYHVLGGVLSALDGAGPEDLHVGELIARARDPGVREVVLALNATVDGATTAHYLADRLVACDVSVTSIARGVPVGGELDYLDDGTLSAALASRRSA